MSGFRPRIRPQTNQLYACHPPPSPLTHTLVGKRNPTILPGSIYSRMNLFSSNASYLWDTSETKYVILKMKIMLILRLSLSILTFSISRKTKHYIEIYSIFLTDWPFILTVQPGSQRCKKAGTLHCFLLNKYNTPGTRLFM